MMVAIRGTPFPYHLATAQSITFETGFVFEDHLLRVWSCGHRRCVTFYCTCPLWFMYEAYVAWSCMVEKVRIMPRNASLRRAHLYVVERKGVTEPD